MGSIEFKNRLQLRDKTEGVKRRENLAKEELKDSTPFPMPVVYEDIDKEMKLWVENELDISFEGKRLPTMVLYSNQRFSEYLQSWKFVDENENLILNFKTISRENNPKSGTINGNTKNIPGDRTYLMKRVQAKDVNNRQYYIDYRMKQPIGIDLVYRISIMTNKYELINDFNLLVNEKFKAIDCYIMPNGHFMSMVLNDISDESEYSIDDRQFYSQSYNITLRAYIMTEENFIVEEKPLLKFMGFEGETSKSSVEIEDLPTDCPYNPYYYQPVKLTIEISECCEKIRFHLDSDFNIDFIKVNQNLRGFKLFINDTETGDTEIYIVTKEDKEEGGIFYNNDYINVGDKYVIPNLNLKNGDEIKICGLKRIKAGIDTLFEFYGCDPSVILDENIDYKENNSGEIDIECEK